MPPAFGKREGYLKDLPKKGILSIGPFLCRNRMKIVATHEFITIRATDFPSTFERFLEI